MRCKWSLSSLWSARKLDADYTNDHDTTLDREQMYDNSIEKSDTLRGGTEIKLYNPSTIVLQADDSKMMETIMLERSSSEQWSVSRRHEGQFQIRKKAQDAEICQVSDRRDKVIYRSPCFALAGAWKSKTEFSKGRRMKSRIATCPNMLCLFEKDHNFRHGAGIQMNPNTMPTSGRHTVSRLAGVWWRG